MSLPVEEQAQYSPVARQARAQAEPIPALHTRKAIKNAAIPTPLAQPRRMMLR